MIDEFGFENSKIQSLEGIKENTRTLEGKLDQLIVINRSTLQELKSLQIKMNQWGYTLGILVIILIARG